MTEPGSEPDPVTAPAAAATLAERLAQALADYDHDPWLRMVRDALLHAWSEAPHEH